MTTVLCVDDNAALAELLYEVILSMKFDPHTVRGGEECLTSLKGGGVKPDIILLDIMMEPMDGWVTLRYIKSDPDLSTIPVVMLTGKYPTTAELDEFSSLIDGYLMKPFAIESLPREIRDVLNRVRLREEFINRARSKGANEQSLREYRGLSSCVSALKQIERIVGDAAFMKDSLLTAEKRLDALKKELNDLGIAAN